MDSISGLLGKYSEKKNAIRQRLAEFEKVLEKSDEELFAELCFCLFTPQSSAKKCDAAIRLLQQKSLLLNGTAIEIGKNISGVRFHNNKAKYLIEARNFFSTKTAKNSKSNKIDLKKFLKGNSFELREFLVKNIKGLGFKEASHFLRNIGLGKNLAILDRHILKNLKQYGGISEIPKTIARKKYLELEKKMKNFSKKVKISLEELDLLFWSNETGEIFK